MSIQAISQRYKKIRPHLDEKARRLWCANEALALGWGGITLVARATGKSRTTIGDGVKELKGTKPLPMEGTRRKGGGRTKSVEKDATLKPALEALIDTSTRGDPMSPLRWCSKSTRNLSEALQRKKKTVSHMLVLRTLQELGYSMQSNRKVHEGGSPMDRDKQFQRIGAKALDFQKSHQPVISVDTKKKELIGSFKNNGREFAKKGHPTTVNVYDFLDKEKGKVAPYGVYDLAKNKGWVSVGVSHDTAQFAVESIRSWWKEMGQERYRNATDLFITADGGGRNGSRNRLWKVELAKLARELSMTIHVAHFPPGTSQWNKIEHRMFSFISKNWRGRPLIDHATVVSLIGNTTTTTGLRIRARLDEREYPVGIKVSDAELSAVPLIQDNFHGEWNYRILPKNDEIILL